MEEQQQEQSRFVCKVCFRKFQCGKSLGGHIRSHGIAANSNSVESEEKFEANMKKISSLDVGGGGSSGELGGHSGYGLRENPKKTFKAAMDATNTTFPLPQERICKQCGKGFQSMKALCGHMACHSEKDRGGLKDDHSWTSENQKLVMDSHSDTESGEEEKRLLRSSRSSKNNTNNKRYKKIIIKSSSLSLAANNNGSSSVSEIDEHEQQEEVAICLMMLSRDSSSNWGGVNSVVESSDNNSVVLETKSSSIEMRIGRKEGLNSVYNQDETPQTRKLETRNLDVEIVEQENSDSGYFLGEEIKVESDGSVYGYQRNSSVYESKSAKANVGVGYEETLAEIKKGFSKFKGQKVEVRKDKYRENGNDDSKYEVRKRIRDSSDNLEMLNESYGRKERRGSLDVVELSKTAHKRSKYECLNCKKIFNSYQALGGHRPCHKKMNAYFDSRYETGENSLEADTTTLEEGNGRKIGESFSNRKASATRVDKKSKSKKNKGHECPFCHRIFKNGQALGGHKRSHFIGGGAAAGEISHRTSIYKPDYPNELIDLNLPAPLEDEG